jgi:Na+/H+ antiporter NhaB
LGYSVYTFAIYAFWIHFGLLFLVYVAVFGLSVYALIGALTGIKIAALQSAFMPSAPTSATCTVLIVVRALFYY